MTGRFIRLVLVEGGIPLQYDAEEWNMEGMVQDGSLYLNIGWDLANSNQWPQWNKSSEFSRPKLAQ